MDLIKTTKYVGETGVIQYSTQMWPTIIRELKMAIFSNKAFWYLDSSGSARPHTFLNA